MARHADQFWRAIGVTVFLATAVCRGQTLEQRLLAEDLPALARDARANGDARRGALLFYQANVGCARCHVATTGQPIAPDLTKLDRSQATDVHLVESVLSPSRVIQKGYEVMLVTGEDDEQISGFLVERNAKRITLRDPSNNRLIHLDAGQVKEVRQSKLSAMPAELVNALGSREAFCDLVKYIIEVRDGGAARASELQPSPEALTIKLPDYEARLDHAGMIKSPDRKSLERGEDLYLEICANCHGTREMAGSLPTSLRFAEGKFKNGSDPYAMYQTITRGYGMMMPQTALVPQQKYDVIHYIREEYLKKHNSSQYVKVDDAYLARLPKGDTRGPKPVKNEPWAKADYGPYLTHSFQVGNDPNNFAYKGIAVRVDGQTPGGADAQSLGGIARGKAWMVFDHDTLRIAAAWTGDGFIDWNGIQYNGRHAIHPRIAGDVHVGNLSGPGWADPRTGSFADEQRVVGRDGRKYGPLPAAWGQYKGLYRSGDDVILSYRVGETDLLEMPGGQTREPGTVFLRTINIGPRKRELVLCVATLARDDEKLDVTGGADESIAHATAGGIHVGLAGGGTGCTWFMDAKRLCLKIPGGEAPIRMIVWMARSDARPWVKWPAEAPDLTAMLRGNRPWWPKTFELPVIRGRDDGPFATDVLLHPTTNPWLARVRLTGHDFFTGGREMAVCTWDGDVWRVSGLDTIDRPGKPMLTWRRIASGLFQPLGLKIVDGAIYVGCRDQIVILRDLDQDGETDFYECFNNQHQVTEHFHEFAMGLQTDVEGNFYYAKSGRHALPAIVPHHGTLLRVSKDGTRTDILATGFRAANGVCLNPDGTFVVTDQEGFWCPKNRINWVKPGGFYGNMFGYHDRTDAADSAMEQPLVWITNAFDRSPAELLWTTSDKWGPLKGSLLNLSYGYGKLYVVPFEEVNGMKQGGMCEFPMPQIPTGVIRGRFHPVDGQLYLTGMYAWASNQVYQEGGLYRVRYTGKPAYLPIKLAAQGDGMSITFTEGLDRAAAADPKNYAVKVWGLKRTANYGSPHVNEHAIAVTAASVSDDGRTVKLTIPDLAPTWCMEIRCNLRNPDGISVQRTIHNTVHAQGK